MRKKQKPRHFVHEEKSGRFTIKIELVEGPGTYWLHLFEDDNLRTEFGPFFSLQEAIAECHPSFAREIPFYNRLRLQQ
jgi:hypothetical protein